MSQIPLLTVPEPDQPQGIDLRCCTVEDLLEAGPHEPTLIVADPPWSYSQAPGHSANPDNHYETVSDAHIVKVLDQAYDTLEKGRMALWCTWPKLGQWFDAVYAGQFRWRYVSGGSWHKEGGNAGTGYHWLGKSEPVLLYVKSTGLCTEWGALRNAHNGPRARHSEKPVSWMEGWIDRWTEPGDLVLDLYAGMGPVARACARTGRRYLGAEVDPERYRMAVDLLAMDRSRYEDLSLRTELLLGSV